jgi:hypothetical protein
MGMGGPILDRIICHVTQGGKLEAKTINMLFRPLVLSFKPCDQCLWVRGQCTTPRGLALGHLSPCDCVEGCAPRKMGFSQKYVQKLVI